MHAVGVLQKCLSGVFASMHRARQRALFGAVGALLIGRRLILMDLARAWPGAEYVRAPLKRLDRLLSNGHLAKEAEQLYASMSRWLIRHPRPVIVVDWSDLKPDGSLCLLRAAVPVGGRTLTVFEAIHPEHRKNSPRIERAFLRRLKALLPASVKPIFVTDAGFRGPWFRAVTELGWDYVGRLRHRTNVKLTVHGEWVANRTLHPQARTVPKRFPRVWIAKNAPWVCDLVLVRRRASSHAASRSKTIRRHAKAQSANRDPWLLATSLTTLASQQVVALYARRMQIEESFRDLKCERFGSAFYRSLTRGTHRLAILLLLHALATFVAWLSALALDTHAAKRYGGITASKARRHYSLLRLGWERLRRPSAGVRTRDLQRAFRHPPQWWLNEIALPG